MSSLNQSSVVVWGNVVAIPSGGMHGANATLAPHLRQFLDRQLVPESRIEISIDRISPQLRSTLQFHYDGVTKSGES